MYGHILKIGLLVPSTNTTIEMDFMQMVPTGVSVHATRLLQPETEDPRRKMATILEMQERIDEASEELASLSPGVIAYGCTAGSFLKGAKEDDALTARISRAAGGIPAVTTATALAEAVWSLGASRIALATPYIESITEREKDYLEERTSARVVASAGLGIVGNLPKGRLPPSAAYELALRVGRSEADVVVISCTNWRTLEVIEPLEAELRKPVVTSNQTTLWASLRSASLTPSIAGFGALLREDP